MISQNDKISMRILYVCNTKASWAQNDYKLLNRHFNTTNLYIDPHKHSCKSINPFPILQYDVIILWFASLSFLPLIFFSWIFRKKIIIIAGGYDVVNLPEIQYGAFLDRWHKNLLRRFMFYASNKVISVSYSNQKEALENAKVPKSKSIMIYHGFMRNQLPLNKFQDRRKQIITIGAINNDTYLRKGHKYFLELARKMTDWSFMLIGKVSSDFLHLQEFQNCQNLTMLGYLPDSYFNEILNESKFYLQLSHHEGFGCSIVDAALMGCYPIVYNRYSMPEIVIGCGEIIKFLDLRSIENTIYELEKSDIDVEFIRSHYLNKFPEEAREKKLIELVNSL